MTNDTLPVPSKADLQAMGTDALLLLQMRLRHPAMLSDVEFAHRARELVRRWEAALAVVEAIEDATGKLLQLPEG